MAPLDPARLIFVVAPPRSGSTLLQRMLASHSAIATHPEPHLLTPLYYLGYYDNVERAPYDHVTAARAVRELCEALPGGEQDYLAALRAYALTLYGGLLQGAGGGRLLFVDKTPAYALILPFVRRLFPTACYVVLTRHPAAIMHSVAHSFFGGDYAAAQAANPIVARYVPAIAALLRQPPPRCVHLRYEALVVDPEAQMRRVLGLLGLPFEPAVVDYGSRPHLVKSFGDPVGVGRHRRPVQASLTTWQNDLAARPAAAALVAGALAALDDDDLTAWGTPRATLWAGAAAPAARRTRRQIDAYRLKRAALLAVRRQVRHPPLAAALRQLRYACDVLLRDGHGTALRR